MSEVDYAAVRQEWDEYAAMEDAIAGMWADEAMGYVMGEVDKLTAERDLAYSVLRKLHPTFSGEYVKAWNLSNQANVLNAEQVALVERLTNE